MPLRITTKLTRRGFLAGGAATVAAGAAATVAAGAAALSLEGCSPQTSPSLELTAVVQAAFPQANVEYLDVDPTQVLPYTGMTNVETEGYLYQVQSFDLPLGSLVFQSSDTQALVLAPGATAKSLIRLGVADLTSGQFTPILGQARGAGEDYVIYEARASESCLIWVECNMVHGRWRVYATPLAGNMPTEDMLLQAALLDEGEATHSAPTVAAAKNKVYWTVMPDPNGPASKEDSYLRAATFISHIPGEHPAPQTVYTSHGRLITVPTVSGDVLTIVPRVDTGSVYYQLTTLDIASDEVRSIAILPPTVRVSDAVWLGDGFAFSIAANYDYARGLSLFGTYLQLGEGRYLYVNRSPVSAAVRINDMTYIKSTKNAIGLNPTTGYAAVVPTPEDCVDYGDNLAGTGLQNRLVLYTTVTARIGQERGMCRVRVFDAT